MVLKRCGLCGRLADEADLILLRGLKGAVCRPGLGCDNVHPAVGAVPQWLTSSEHGFGDVDLNDVFVDNPKH